MIDFSTLQGLTIPEGVVTQIADANGEVLWKLATEDEGEIYYLRPSADISVDSTLTLTPADATAAYMLINEEVSDGASTRIGVAASSEVTNVSGSASFSLEGYVPETISRVIDFKVAISGDTPSSTVTVDGFPTNGSSIRASIYINGAAIVCNFSADATSDLFQGASYSVRYPNGFMRVGASGRYEEVSKEVILAEINDYITANGVLPNIELGIELHASYVSVTDSGGKSSGVAGYADISQAYVVLRCE